MTSRFIGFVVGTRTRTVYEMIEPDNDNQLADPRWLMIHNDQGEPVQMLKLLRIDYASTRTDEDLKALIAAKL